MRGDAFDHLMNKVGVRPEQSFSIDDDVRLSYDTVEHVVSTAIDQAALVARNELQEKHEESLSLIQQLKKEIADLREDLRKKTTDMRNQITASKDMPMYQFGGFSPQMNDLNIGPPAVQGAWRIVKVGTDLEFQRYESGSWTLKGSFTP